MSIPKVPPAGANVVPSLSVDGTTSMDVANRSSQGSMQGQTPIVAEVVGDGELTSEASAAGPASTKVAGDVGSSNDVVREQAYEKIGDVNDANALLGMDEVKEDSETTYAGGVPVAEGGLQELAPGLDGGGETFQVQNVLGGYGTVPIANVSAETAKNEKWMAGLKAGEPEAIEALHNIDPSSLSSGQVADLARLSAGIGVQEGLSIEKNREVVASAKSLLQTAAHEDKAFGEKLAAAAKLMKPQDGQALATVAEDVLPYAPGAVAGLLDTSMPNEARQAALAAFHHQMKSDGPFSEQAATALFAKGSFSEAELTQPGTEELLKKAGQKLEQKFVRTGALSSEEMRALVRNAQKHGSAMVRPLRLLGDAMAGGVPKADEEFARAAMMPESWPFTTREIRERGKEFGAKLLPHLSTKTNPHSNNQMALDETKRWVRSKFAPPIGHTKMKEFQKAFAKELKEKFKTAPKDSKMGEFRRLLQAKYILSKPKKFDVDPSDFDQGKLQARMDQLAKSNFGGELETLRKSLRNEVFGKNDVSAEKLQNYLEGDDYKTYLSLLPEKQRSRSIKNQLAQLASLDPKKAKQTANALSQGLLLNEGMSQLAKMPPGKREALVKSAFEKVLGHGQKATDAAKTFFDALDGRQLSTGKINKMASDFGMSSKALGGTLSVLSGLSLLSQSEQFETTEGALAELGNISKGLDGLSLADWALKNSSKFAQGVAKGLGPLGDTFSAASDMVSMADAIDRGDTNEAVLKGISGAGGALSAVGGGLMAAGSSGAWPLLLAGGAVSLVGWIGDALFGDSPATDFLEELRLQKN